MDRPGVIRCAGGSAVGFLAVDGFGAVHLCVQDQEAWVFGGLQDAQRFVARVRPVLEKLGVSRCEFRVL
jgi:hypothetical protein